MKIEAAVVERTGEPFTMQVLDLEEPRADEVRVRIVAVGLCHTDVAFQHGAVPFQHPFVLGHEGAGVVEAVGADVTSVKPGDRVTISFRSCGACPKCDEGLPPYCHTMPLLNYAGMRPDGTTSLSRDGAPVQSNFFGQSSFATHCLTYERNLVKIPADLPFEIACPLGCGVQTGTGSILKSMDCRPGAALMITGGGTVGLSAVMAAKIRGCNPIILVEPNAERRALGMELGATHTVDPLAGDLAAAIRAIVPIGVDYAFDTSGRPEVLTAVMQCLAPRGLFGIVGIPPAGTPVPGDMNQVMTFGHRVMGIIEGDADPATFIPELMAYHAKGQLPLERLIKTYPLTEINHAIEAQHHGDCVKAVLLTGQPG